jgi:hypothetical protein
MTINPALVAQVCIAAVGIGSATPALAQACAPNAPNKTRCAVLDGAAYATGSMIPRARIDRDRAKRP